MFLGIFGKYLWVFYFKRRWLRFKLKGQFIFCFYSFAGTLGPSRRKDYVIKNRIFGHPACEYATLTWATHRKMTINLALGEFCSPLKVSQCFGGTCLLHLQSCRISQERNQHESGSKQSNLFAKTWVYVGKQERTARQLICFHWLSQRTGWTVGEKTWKTSVSPEKGCCVDLGTSGRQILGVQWMENQAGCKRSHVHVL
jgi:hypothetical protein